MNSDTFEIAYNKEHLEYYSYLREVLEAPEVSYWMGNPSVQITNGIIYASLLEQELDYTNMDNPQQYMQQYKKNMIDYVQKNQSMFSRALLLIGIPSCKAPVEVFDRFEPYIQWIQEAKVIKTSHSKYYGMLLLLESEQKAFALFKDLLGQEYNALDMQRILLREIKEITIQCTGGPHLENQKNIYHFKKTLKEDQNQRVHPLKIFLKTSEPVVRKLSSSISPIKKIHTQMHHSHSLSPSPSVKREEELEHQKKPQETSLCTICLQINSGTIISILCEHYFHIKCLYRWKQDTCPLCRYHQQPPLIKFCEKCNQCEGLWVCLVCGARLCCGSGHDILGEGSHIYEHYLETQHRLSMDVETKFIFDASQAAFLHKMFYQQIMKSGGIEHLQLEEENKNKKKNKLSEKISQFQQNISEEMQIQRVYFEETINKEVKASKDKIKQKRRLVAELENQIKHLDKQTQEVDTKIHQSEENIQKLEKELKVILDVQRFWKEKAEQRGNESKLSEEKQYLEIMRLNTLIVEKREELKDYKTNLTLQNKLKSSLGKDKIQAQVYLGNDAKKQKKGG